MIKLKLIFFSCIFALAANAQTPAHLVRPGDTLKKDAFINT
ncbi:MAG: hypothetical protein RLZ33_1611, partial [Bacteroidota bacterium]